MCGPPREVLTERRLFELYGVKTTIAVQRDGDGNELGIAVVPTDM